MERTQRIRRPRDEVRTSEAPTTAALEKPFFCADSAAQLEQDVLVCARCPRLVRWRTSCASSAPRAFRGQPYWSRAVPGFGDPKARLLILGLAPGAHGANRTGRPFTGDDSGEFLFAALHHLRLADAPRARARDDGLRLRSTWITNAVRCVPPDNTPTRSEFERCERFTLRELALLGGVRVILCLGAKAWAAALRALGARGHSLPRPLPKFRHGAECELGAITLFATFHPSRLNTRTGRLTAAMFEDVLARARVAMTNRPT